MEPVSRRRFILGAVSATAALGAGLGWLRWFQPDDPMELPPARPDLPARQHAWNEFSAVDDFGNVVPPRFHRLLMLDVDGRPGPEHRTRLEAVLRTLEGTFPWRADGLVFAIGWSASYFDLIGRPSPIPPARAVSPIDDPVIDSYHACLHLASDDEARLGEVEKALIGERTLDPSRRLDLRGVLGIRETRTGFVGSGIPAERQNVAGIPEGRPVPADAPLFMGFRSGFRRNQATEDDVTIDGGPMAGGSTMRVTRFRLALDGWYRLLDQQQRVDRMFSPTLDAEQVAELTDEAPTDADNILESTRRTGVVGHLQATAQVRRDGRPRILRRDFDTTDGGRAGLHFVSLQRDIADFEATRIAMDANDAQFEHPGVGPRINNGINEFIFALNEASFVLPPRSMRSFPLLPE